MGTRNITMVVSGRATKLAQYGQWDGYPEGQGLTVLAFSRDNLRTPDDRAAFAHQLELVRFISPEQFKGLWEKVLGAPIIGDKWRPTDAQVDEFKRRHPYFTRDHGAEILSLVAKADGPVETRDETDFLADSLMCEWAYVIDLDQLTLEVFRGFNKKPLDERERFHRLTELSRKEWRGADQYFPVRHLRSWRLDDLPSDEAFLRGLQELLSDND